MLIVLSPAKRLDWEVPQGEMLPPRLGDQAAILAGHARQLTLGDLKSLMGLSDDLARLNRARFRALKAAPGPGDERPAALAFAGDTYRGLDYATLDAAGRDFAEDRLRILSGLYGLLRPRDAIRPHRLEMGSRLKTRRGVTLTDFWGDRIGRLLAEDAGAVGTGTLLNCASHEYFAAVHTRALGLRVITPRFLDVRDGAARVVSFHAKRARGALARFVCENRIVDAADLAGFALGGYALSPELSAPDAPAFVRPEAESRAA